ncbi:type II secretion system F family protein [Streptomyces sp. WMMC940]|uniref:type II secretion system F family protein n=1 Tax=Streptomyces sp. WMMC940 TaxID=3015153 RepID=UPI0022B7481A|nr:type II secretion system F family protein [Streptomyces sp. WMMC940]MCZ7458857.1 type II secretion system F family protein [Streptomyces sp. WMMC940]
MGDEFLRILGIAVPPAAAAAWTVRRLRRRQARRRLHALLGPGAARHGTLRRRRPVRAPAWVGPWAAPVVAVFTGWVVAGGITGCLLGLAGAYGLRRWQRGRARDRAAGASERRVSDQLPLAAELLAACLSAGAGPGEAALAVGQSLGGPVGERLEQTAAELRLGSEPARAWGRFGEIPGASGLARCLEQAAATGAPAAEPVARLAAGLRAEKVRIAASRAQRAQVLITAPVGLCFLPAFLAIGVAPVVIGLATGLLHGNGGD